MQNGFFNSLNRVNQNVNVIMKEFLAFKVSGFQRYWFLVFFRIWIWLSDWFFSDLDSFGFL
jgi:hypothetical protein